MASWMLFFESLMIYCNNLEAGSTNGINDKANSVRQEKYTIVYANTLQICASNDS